VRSRSIEVANTSRPSSASSEARDRVEPAAVRDPDARDARGVEREVRERAGLGLARRAVRLEDVHDQRARRAARRAGAQARARIPGEARASSAAARV
jgi:hypothetical protein